MPFYFQGFRGQINNDKSDSKTLMERNKFLQITANLTLVNYSLIKRLFPESSLKEIKDTLKGAERAKLVHRHIFQGFDCFSVTKLGFQVIGIEHSPNYYRFTKSQANRICRGNHLRFGIEQELGRYNNITLESWIGGGSFHKRPLVTQFDHAQQILKPEGLALIRFPEGITRLYFIHYWKNFEQVSKDLFFYFLYQARGEHTNRFPVDSESGLRILCIVPNYKCVYEVKDELRNLKGEAITLFVPESKVHVDNPLESEIWLDCQEHKRKVF